MLNINNLQILFYFIYFSIFSQIGRAQIVTLDPPFATVDDTITILFDATQGSKGLIGENQVYMHAGLITNLSGVNEWRYVQGNWGQDDPRVKMTNVGENVHSFTFYIPDFFGVSPTEEVLELAFVFRNRDGSKTGKTAAGGDIFVPLYPVQTGLAAQRILPPPIQVTSPHDTIPILVQANQRVDFYVTEGTDTLFTTLDTTLLNTYLLSQPGHHRIQIVAISMDTIWQDSFDYTEADLKPAEPISTGILPGIHISADQQLQVLLEAPGKKWVHLMGTFTNWLPLPEYQLVPDTSGNFWWGIWPLSDLDSIHLYQYLVDGAIRIADPYSTLILDPSYDPSLGPNFPDLPAYPSAKTSGIITWLRPDVPFTWQADSYSPSANVNLNVYELLIRDFLADHSYASLRDTLDYLQRLGINAIELMPISEFEGNESWGYNPDFHMALDKYYGTPEAFKAVVDAAHQRGMAIILDVVFNHVTGLSPLAQLYWNNVKNQPAADNPWLNETPRHPFNVFNDFNHESVATQRYMDRVLRYWVETFHVDGFRFDLSKGFTQNLTTNNTAMSTYDPSRVSILNRMASALRTIDPDLILILEHFADLEEETILAEQGFLLWNNVGGPFIQAAQGYNGDLSGAAYTSKGWDTPNAMSYMESHDEERMMYRVLNQGNQNLNYSLRELPNGLRHAGLSAVFFLSIPGPKMIWEFGELGYEYSINTCPDGSISNDCRLANKPIRWDYQLSNDRKRLYTTYQELYHMRNSIGAFKTQDFDLDLTQLSKQITLRDADSTVIVTGNFAIVERTADVQFTHSGWWYDFVSGDSLQVTDLTIPLQQLPGEYRIWSDFRWDSKSQTTSRSRLSINDLTAYPNPATDYVFLTVQEKTRMESIEMHSIEGKAIPIHIEPTGNNFRITWNSTLPKGIYVISIQANSSVWRQKFIIQ